LRLARHLLFTSLTLAVFAPAAWGFDGGAWTVGKGEWYSEIQGSRSSASDYFLSDGNDTQPGLVLDGGWKAPLGYEKELQPTLGNGRQEVFAAAHIGIELPLINGFAQGSRGFRFVGELGDVRVNSTADLAGWIGNRVLVGGRYLDEGVWSSNSAISEAPHSYAAGPVVLVRMDERLDLSLGSFYRWAGRNVDKTFGYYLTVSFRQTKLNRLEGFLGTTKF